MTDEESPSKKEKPQPLKPPQEPGSESSATVDSSDASASTDAPRELRPPFEPTLVNKRLGLISVLSILIGVASGYISFWLKALIGLITNFAFFGRYSTKMITPFNNHLGLWVIAIPIIGALIVGVIARYGDSGIRGHGMPEAIESVIAKESQMHARLTILKPLASAIAIGTGGPFGAEGPIIATGAALGSTVGQVIRTTAMERKTLLAAGAAGGMAATFGSPIAAVLLAMELFLFEFRPRSLIPVAMACVAATAVRIAYVGTAPIFGFKDAIPPSTYSLIFYIAVGALVGTAGVLTTQALYWLEGQYRRLPIHWMWWPAIGAVVIGVVGFFAPRTLGVGYDNIHGVLNGTIFGWAALFLGVMKLISWTVSLASGTAGGTIAPLFIIGGALGSACGAVGVALFPMAHIDIRIAALVGMAAIFTGASRAMMTAVVFSFETTYQALGLIPLLGGCSVAYLISSYMMKNTIYTEKVARHGYAVPTEYSVDDLEQQMVKDAYTKDVVWLKSDQTVHQARQWLKDRQIDSHHHGFPVLNENGQLLGVVNYRAIMQTKDPVNERITKLITRAPSIVYDDNSLRVAADHMVIEGVGRLPVVSRDSPNKIIGIISRSDILAKHDKRLRETYNKNRNIWLGKKIKKSAEEGED